MNKIENGPLCGRLEKDIGKQEIMLLDMEKIKKGNWIRHTKVKGILH